MYLLEVVWRAAAWVVTSPLVVVSIVSAALLFAGLGFRGRWFRVFLTVVLGTAIESGVALLAFLVGGLLPATGSGEWTGLGNLLLSFWLALFAAIPAFILSHRLVSSWMSDVPERGPRSNVLLGLGAVGLLAAGVATVRPSIPSLMMLKPRSTPRPVHPQERAHVTSLDTIPPRASTTTTIPPRPSAPASSTRPDPEPRPPSPTATARPFPAGEWRSEMESPIPAGRTLTREEEIAILRQRLRKSQSIFVRVKAADALSLRGDKESVPDIAALMPRADSIEDQATLCQALAHLGAREYGPAAVEWLRRLIAEDRACAACFRCVLGYGVAGAADILIDSATRGTPQNRRQALAALGGFMFAPSYNQPRVAALYDSDADVRRAGCESLVQAQHVTRDRALPDALTRPPACEIMRNRDWRPTADALRAMAEGPSTVKR